MIGFLPSLCLTLGLVQGNVTSELRPLVEGFRSDEEALKRRYDAEASPERAERLRAFYETTRSELSTTDTKSFGLEGRIDLALLENEIAHELVLLERDERSRAELAPLLPFAEAIWSLHDARRRLETPDPKMSAESLVELAEAIRSVREATPEVSKNIALRASRRLDELRELITGWHGHFAGYDPLFTWWTRDPFEDVTKELDETEKHLREDLLGMKEGEDEPIVGDPIGREALLADLAYERIAYSPEELVAIAEREFAWCENEMKKASAEMGLGEDWKAALERVKQAFVPPGEQPALVAISRARRSCSSKSASS